MKEFKKTVEGAFICEECGLMFLNIRGLSAHIQFNHIKKIYYDDWLKEIGDDLCKICNKPTIFISINAGYKNCCCKEHGLKYIDICAKKALKEKYGVESPFELNQFREKSKKTKKERYGNEKYTNNKKSKQTKKERYGDENYNNHEKCKQTCLEIYGVDNSRKCKKVREKEKETKKERYGDGNYNNREKYKDTCLNRYGVSHPMKNKDIFEKSQKNEFLLKQYKNTKIYYRGSYELDFLEKYFYKYTDIINAKTIKYLFKNKRCVYYPDFYIPSLNLIIECKNSWLAIRDKELIDVKEEATILSGFNYIMIVDKDYKYFKENIDF